MRNVVFAAALAVATVIGSSGIASAACTYGLWSGSTNTHNASYDFGYAQCQVANGGFTFTARTYMRGTCQAFTGCRSVSVMRNQLCWGWLGIGAQVQGTKVNFATGVVTPNATVIVTPNSWGCGDQITQSMPAPSTWLIDVRCRIGHSCS